MSGASTAPHAPQKRKPSGFSRPHEGQITPTRLYDGAIRFKRAAGPPSGEPPRRRALGDEAAETGAIPRHERVERVHEPRGAQCAKQPCQWPCERDLGEERDGSAAVACDRCSVPEHEPPAVVARLFRHGGEELRGLVIAQRQECEFVPSVERGDDTRRPATELSGARVDQNRARARFLPYESRAYCLTQDYSNVSLNL
jgi:hypothetical protein